MEKRNLKRTAFDNHPLHIQCYVTSSDIIDSKILHHHLQLRKIPTSSCIGKSLLTIKLLRNLIYHLFFCSFWYSQCGLYFYKSNRIQNFNFYSIMPDIHQMVKHTFKTLKHLLQYFFNVYLTIWWTPGVRGLKNLLITLMWKRPCMITLLFSVSVDDG